VLNTRYINCSYWEHFNVVLDIRHLLKRIYRKLIKRFYKINKRLRGHKFSFRFFGKTLFANWVHYYNLFSTFFSECYRFETLYIHFYRYVYPIYSLAFRLYVRFFFLIRYIPNYWRYTLYLIMWAIIWWSLQFAIPVL
jgi:hypothetical protein